VVHTGEPAHRLLIVLTHLVCPSTCPDQIERSVDSVVEPLRVPSADRLPMTTFGGIWQSKCDSNTANRSKGITEALEGRYPQRRISR
jgi:hypothetical protein